MVLLTDGLELLDEQECRSLLSQRRIGRVGVCVGAMPAIFPVSYVIVDDDIVFLSAPGTKVRAAVEHAVVAFEVDDADDDHETGWSVLVVGRAEEVHDEAFGARAEAAGLHPWLPGRHCLIRVSTDVVSGCRI